MLIRGQDRLLLALAALGDIFENLADAGGIMSFSYKQVYGFIPPKYQRHNFYMAVRNSLKVGNIEKISGKGGPYLRLTGRGKNKVIRDFSFFSLQKKGWDKKWRIVLFDIEEENRSIRDRFREKLCELGFGMLQRSVYISPFPIEKEMREFIESLNLQDRAYLLVSPRLLAGNEKVLAQKVWDLEKINKAYVEILDEIEELKEGDLKKKRELGARFLDVLAVDPHLPKELLPKDWLGIEVRRKLFQLLKDIKVKEKGGQEAKT